jgi:hypothetical protein
MVKGAPTTSQSNKWRPVTNIWVCHTWEAGKCGCRSQAMGWGLRNWEIFVLLKMSETSCVTHPTFYPVETGDPFSQGYNSCEVEHSLPSGVEVMNAWSSSCTPTCTPTWHALYLTFLFMRHSRYLLCNSLLSSSSLVFSLWAGFWQEPEPSQAAGMALARCILGKFLGVVCHCFILLLYCFSIWILPILKICGAWIIFINCLWLLWGKWDLQKFSCNWMVWRSYFYYIIIS